MSVVTGGRGILLDREPGGPLAMWIPGVSFVYVERDKKRRNPKAIRARLPKPKGNANKIITRRIGGRTVAGVSPVERVVAAEAALVKVIPPNPGAPLAGGIRLEVEFRFEPAPSWPAWKRAAACAGLVLCLEHDRGDLEQLAKLLLDALETAGWIEDDCRVVDLHLRKRYAREQGYLVRVADLGPGLTTRAEALKAGVIW